MHMATGNNREREAGSKTCGPEESKGKGLTPGQSTGGEAETRRMAHCHSSSL